MRPAPALSPRAAHIGQACSDLSLCLRSWEGDLLLLHDVLMTGCGCRHTSTELTSLLSIELDSLRSFIFSNVSRDRGLRAILEASGAVLVSLAASASPGDGGNGRSCACGRGSTFHCLRSCALSCRHRFYWGLCQRGMV